MKILVTGSNGFLGKEILKVLGSNVIFTLNRSYSDYNFDLSKSIPKFNHNFDLIIHAAGKAHMVPKSDTERNLIIDNNIVGTRNLLAGILKVGVPKQFVFISSVSVYGLVFGQNISEDSELIAEDPYGKSKIEAEKYVSEWCTKYNVICTIFRLPLVVGLNPPGNLGAMIDGIKRGYYFNIGGGIAKKSMVLASDVSSIIITASKVGGVYNLTDGYHPNFYQLSYSIAKQLGKKHIPNIPYILGKLIGLIGDRFGYRFPINSVMVLKITSTLTFDDSKARKAFGWNPIPILKSFKI
jgi:nucleoside-diphosphate-sugar epimerase